MLKDPKIASGSSQQILLQLTVSHLSKMTPLLSFDSRMAPGSKAVPVSLEGVPDSGYCGIQNGRLGIAVNDWTLMCMNF